jgi:hypothetical protein
MAEEKSQRHIGVREKRNFEFDNSLTMKENPLFNFQLTDFVRLADFEKCNSLITVDLPLIPTWGYIKELKDLTDEEWQYMVEHKIEPKTYDIGTFVTFDTLKP